MIWNIYRFILCIFMAFFINESLEWMFNDEPISPAWANFAFIVATISLWERLTFSIRLQNHLKGK
jgi:hypothetical protein